MLIDSLDDNDALTRETRPDGLERRWSLAGTYGYSPERNRTASSEGTGFAIELVARKAIYSSDLLRAAQTADIVGTTTWLGADT